MNVSGAQTANAIDWQAALAEHRRWLRTVVTARCGEPQAVDEIMQEVALAAVKQQAPLQDSSKVAPWLYQLAVRQSLLYRRKMGRQRNLTQRYAEREPNNENHESGSDPLSWMLAEEKRSRIRQAIAKLPSDDAEMLLLKYTEDWSYKEIAQHLGLSRSAVESRLHRARQKMRQKLVSLDVLESKK